MTPDDMDALVHGCATFARPALDRLVEENAALRRDLKRAYAMRLVALPGETPQHLRALLDKQIKDDAGVVAEPNAILVTEALIDDLLKLIQEEATQKLANYPTPRMIVETRGEAKALVEMQQAELARLKADTRQFLAGIVQTYRDNPAFDLHHAVAQMRLFIEQKL